MAIRPDDGRVLRGNARRIARKAAAVALTVLDNAKAAKCFAEGAERNAYLREWDRIIRTLDSGKRIP